MVLLYHKQPGTSILDAGLFIKLETDLYVNIENIGQPGSFVRIA